MLGIMLGISAPPIAQNPFKQRTFHKLNVRFSPKVQKFKNIQTLFINKRPLSQNKRSLMLSNMPPTAPIIFPTWESFIPSVGTFHSQAGNNLFP